MSDKVQLWLERETRDLLKSRCTKGETYDERIRRLIADFELLGWIFHDHPELKKVYRKSEVK